MCTVAPRVEDEKSESTLADVKSMCCSLGMPINLFVAHPDNISMSYWSTIHFPNFC